MLVGDETLLAFKSLMFDFTDMYKAVAEARFAGAAEGAGDLPGAGYSLCGL